MGQLEGKKAVIVGAAGKGNMGQAIAKRFRKEGADVLVTSRRGAELEEFAREIGGYSTVCDLTKRDDVFDLAKVAKEKMGRVDIAINSTGINLGGPFLEYPEDKLDRMIALQFKGPFFFLQAFVEAMDQGGSIIQITSAVSLPNTPVFDHEAYMGTKAGIDQVIRAVANQFGSRGLRLNSLAAGHTHSPMNSAVLRPWRDAAFIEQYPLGRLGTSDDVAAACVWLSTDECFMTGQTLNVSGGLTLRRNPLPQDFERAEREWFIAHPEDQHF